MYSRTARSELGVLKLTKFLPVDPLVLLRFVNLVYQAIAIAVVVAALRNVGASRCRQ